MRHSEPSKRDVAKVVLAVSWLFVTVAVYFWAHKPFDQTIVSGLVRTFLNVTVWLVLVWIGTAVGLAFLANAVELPAEVQLALAAGLGLGIISIGVLLLGLIGLLSWWVAWGGILVLCGLLWRRMAAVVKVVRSVRLPRAEHGYQRCIVVFACASLLMTFVAALAPPTGWDTLVYHLTGPRLFVEAGRIVHPVDLPYLGFPQLMGMQYTLGLLLVGEGVAPLLHFGYGLLALVLVVGLARQVFGAGAAWLAGGVFLSVPTLLGLMARAYVDAALLFYATAAFGSFVLWKQALDGGSREHGRRWLLMIGLFCGLCGTVKYTAVGVCLAIGISLFLVSWRQGLGVLIRRLGFVALVAGLVMLPGLVENYLTTRNPFYPFVSSSGIYWDEWRSWWYDRAGTGLLATAPLRLITALLEASLLGVEGSASFGATIGPVVAPGLFLLFLVWSSMDAEERALLAHMLVFFAVNYVIWLVGLARTALLFQTRLLFPVFGVMSIMGGAAYDRLSRLNRPNLRVGWIAKVVLLLVLGLGLLSQFTEFVVLNPLVTVIGIESRSEYLTRRLGWYYVAIDEMNRDLSSDAKVLFLWEPRSYHCQVDCVPDALLDRWLHATYSYGYDASAIAEAWRLEGVTHVLVFETGLEGVLDAGFDPVSTDDLRVLDDLLTEHTTGVNTWDGHYILYELTQ